MHLKTVFIRFYKSFNDDFIRKNDSRVRPKSWELINQVFHPYIEVPIEPKITTIVGANESGKSHLLSAIEKAISGEKIKRSDFCRYSTFFTVKKNELKYPDFGLEWAALSDSERGKVRELASIPESISFDEFLIFRQNINELSVYLSDKGKYTKYKIENHRNDTIQELLPEVIKIASNIALPSSVPIKKLVELGQSDYFGSRKFELLDRKQRNEIVDTLDVFGDNPDLITKARNLLGYLSEEIDNVAVDSLKSIVAAIDENKLSDEEKGMREAEFSLAYKLICKIAQVDTDALLDLAEAVKDGMQGYANGILEKINRQLAVNLNFPNFWAQDRNFSLKVMARDYDLVFTITDRTGTEYSFDERSQGLRFFLSYYIQYRAHQPHLSKSEILLMDEPDAYLSSQAQQDLLKVFDLFSSPSPGSHLTKPIQVIYVTHSPFLIDKNHAERIRVLKKGNEDEGTRVVRDAAKNHYEPLRSSIGAYVGETAFIGNCNLMVEGLSDQILIAGATTYLRSIGTPNLETLDLNQVTIVPAGSASHIPYLVYLARGRDVEQPAVIVLLDSDKSGDDAKKHLFGKGGQHRRPLLKKEFVFQIAELKDADFFSGCSNLEFEIEDLVPLPICVQAAKLYLREFLGSDENDLEFLTEDAVTNKFSGKTVLDTIKDLLSDFPDRDLTINKVGFSRNVVRVVSDWSKKKGISPYEEDSINKFECNFKLLFKQLNMMQRRAQQKLSDEKLSQKVERLKGNFNAMHPISARREDGIILLDEIDAILDNNVKNESVQEIEAIRNAIKNLRRDYKLDEDMNKSIDDYVGFQRGLERVKYAGLLSSQEEDLVMPQPLSEVEDSDIFIENPKSDDDSKVKVPLRQPPKQKNQEGSNGDVSQGDIHEKDIKKTPLMKQKRKDN
ncbi:AAA family ATPase [Leptolyngbya sp. PCC 6406]|uniref:AAA family ATPase n=1 Tax=Leptolyngbya sp. PCC 6406 TaxID=1173264 RepID=UPI0002AB9EDA|nr:AAA family ATPase [Leptolyngbya sp. PCC 6406]